MGTWLRFRPALLRLGRALAVLAYVAILVLVGLAWWLGVGTGS
jgi:hypothetical protein